MKSKIPWEIIISKLRGNITSEETTVFENWLAQDDNRHLFQQLEKVWANIQKKVANYEPDLEYYWLELSKRIHIVDTPQEIHVPFYRKFTAISRTQFYRIAVVASLLLILSLPAVFYLGKNNSQQSATLSYTSLTGKSKVVLPDGSEVWLHSHTTLKYNSDFESETRNVDLNGEAYFVVTHNAKKPFIVSTNNTKVVVHGTKFNVNSYDSSDNVLVSLFEGSVSMQVAEKDVMLKPGQEGNFNKAEQTLIVKNGDVGFAKSWTDEQLRFENKNLRYVCRYLSKWYSVKIDIDPSIDDNQSYTFTVHNENLEEIMRILTKVNSIDYSFNNDNELFIKQKE